jgi:mannose-6-phosphate isomerase
MKAARRRPLALRQGCQRRLRSTLQFWHRQPQRCRTDMTLERTVTRNIPKPWGSTDLRPWNAHHGDAIGEIWFERTAITSPNSALLLKLLFTTEPLSIQVHPGDAFARSIGLTHGKSEAWYILAALPNARIALGLKRRVSPSELRASIAAGSIAELVQWRRAKAGEVIFVPAGTIHSIGAGLVIMEIQQRSDATFRLFDYGRGRELDAENAIAVARGEQAERQAPLRKLTKERTLLVASRHFVLERFELPPGSDWELRAATETWLFALDGGAWVGALDACTNEAIFLEADSARIRVRSRGLTGLVAYVGSDPIPNLLRSLEGESAGMPKTEREQSTTQPVLGVTSPATQPQA